MQAMLNKTFLFTILGTALLIACSKDMSPITSDQPMPMRSLTSDEQYIADAASNFGFDLFKTISEYSPEKTWHGIGL
jgi:hypothetical protein